MSTDLAAIAAAAECGNIDSLRAYLSRTLERAIAQQQRIIASLDAGGAVEDYCALVEDIQRLTSSAHTLAVRLDILAGIARTLAATTTEEQP